MPCKLHFLSFLHHYDLLLPYAVDIISAIEFDKSGDHLATGDRGGRVVLFERTDVKDVCSTNCQLLYYCILLPFHSSDILVYFVFLSFFLYL